MKYEESLSLLNEYRSKIDIIDNEIKNLLKSRVEYIEAIAEIKRKIGYSTFDSNREEDIFRRITKNLEGNKLRYVQNVFERIIDESRALQRKILGRK